MKYGISILVCFIILIMPVLALERMRDTDRDGITDITEIEIYHTNPSKADSDNDGYSDWVELNHSYSPLNKKPVKLETNDQDYDGLSDKMELNFGTSLAEKDSDGDGYADGQEIRFGYDPLHGGGAKLKKKIEINIKKQELSYFLGGVRLGAFPVSTGVPKMPTPKGEFKIDGKNPKAWSSYGLWMPYWMSLKHGYFGIHELPIWPNGRREGEDHLGHPASHGCIRLGAGPAKTLYDWAEIGTPVVIF